MEQKTLRDILIEQKGYSPEAAEAAAHKLVREILRNLRQGETVPLPGLGEFKPGKQPRFRFEQTVDSNRGRRGKR